MLGCSLLASALHDASSHHLLLDQRLSVCVQKVRVGPHLSTAPHLDISSPQGCVPSPLLYSSHTCQYNDTGVVGLISSPNETAYREEV